MRFYVDSDWYEWRLDRWRERQAVSGSAPVGNAAVRAAVLAGPSAATPGDAAQPDVAAVTEAPAAAAAAGGAREFDAAAAAAEAANAGGVAPAPTGTDANAMVHMDGGFGIEAATYDRLFPYQQVGVKWMWELHLQRAGGASSDLHSLFAYLVLA